MTLIIIFRTKYFLIELTCSRESIIGNVMVVEYSSNIALMEGMQVNIDEKVKLRCNDPMNQLIGRDIALCLGADKWDRENVILCSKNEFLLFCY